MRKPALLFVLLALGCSRQTQPAAGARGEQQKAQAGAAAQPSTAAPQSAGQQPSAPPGTSGTATLTAEPTQPSGAANSTSGTATPGSASSQQSSAQITKHDTDTPLVVAGQTYHFVVHTLRLEHPGPRRPDDDETVEAWELRDRSGNVAYQESLGTPSVRGNGFESTESVGASAFTTQQGSGVLVDGEGLPSAPDSGGWTLVLGLHDGKLIPFGPPIYANEYLGLGTDPQRVAQELQNPKLMPMHDVLKFRLWTGNFNIVYPVLINWFAARLEPAWRCIRGSGTAQVERCSYEVKASPFPVKEQTFVRLYELTEDTGRPQHVVVQPGTKIEFLEAEVHVTWNSNAKALTLDPQSEDVWLKIRINGREGWIHSQEDFDAVGLPMAG